MENSAFVYVVFTLVYLGMIFGRLPRLALDRTGIVVLGAIALIASGHASLEGGRSGIDVSAILLLFGFMVISAQFRLGGFYSEISRRIAALPFPPAALLGTVILFSGLLSALLTNDVVCLAVTPVLGQGCIRRGLNPLPFFLALACAANIGSALTLIGNPQNMLIGQFLGLSFGGYLVFAVLPVALSLLFLWAIVLALFRGRFFLAVSVKDEPERPFNAWQTAKGGIVLGTVITLFLFTSLPRDLVALGAAGVLLLSRTMASRRTLDTVDWQLLALFLGLFVVNGAFEAAGGLEMIEGSLSSLGVSLSSAPWLYGVTTFLSNLVSNVPAVMLLLPMVRDIPGAGYILAVSSTFAGNLLIVGSIANIIVAGEAERMGLPFGWKEHARVGVPVTLASLAAGLASMAFM
jgi:Na+/H+ antiporter NhaD/arsenite permease-like protein